MHMCRSDAPQNNVTKAQWLGDQNDTCNFSMLEWRIDPDWQGAWNNGT
jgi:hypothetical protein